MLGTKHGAVQVVKHQPLWASHFERERELLQRILGEGVIGIEHVGSTSIPGLDAKPTLDMMAGFQELKSADCYTARLEGIGYELRPDHPVPGRLHFAKIRGGLRTHNLSLTTHGSDFWEEHLLFRDYLRSHPEVARAYQELKHGLAGKHPEDAVQYSAGKDVFIAEVLAEAREWRAAQRTAPQ